MSDDDSCSSCEMMIDIGGAEDDFDVEEEEENERVKAEEKLAQIKSFKTATSSISSANNIVELPSNNEEKCLSKGVSLNKEQEQQTVSITAVSSSPPPPVVIEEAQAIFTPSIDSYVMNTGKYACSVECCVSSLHSDA